MSESYKGLPLREWLAETLARIPGFTVDINRDLIIQNLLPYFRSGEVFTQDPEKIARLVCAPTTVVQEGNVVEDIKASAENLIAVLRSYISNVCISTKEHPPIQLRLEDLTREHLHYWLSAVMGDEVKAAAQAMRHASMNGQAWLGIFRDAKQYEENVGGVADVIHRELKEILEDGVREAVPRGVLIRLRTFFREMYQRRFGSLRKRRAIDPPPDVHPHRIRAVEEKIIQPQAVTTLSGKPLGHNQIAYLRVDPETLLRELFNKVSKKQFFAHILPSSLKLYCRPPVALDEDVTESESVMMIGGALALADRDDVQTTRKASKMPGIDSCWADFSMALMGVVHMVMHFWHGHDAEHLRDKLAWYYAFALHYKDHAKGTNSDQRERAGILACGKLWVAFVHEHTMAKDITLPWIVLIERVIHSRLNVRAQYEFSDSAKARFMKTLNQNRDKQINSRGRASGGRVVRGRGGRQTELKQRFTVRGVCNDWNIRACDRATCKFEHKCGICGEAHPASQHPPS